jgi:uncharacterized protein with FMN-binding domain
LPPSTVPYTLLGALLLAGCGADQTPSSTPAAPAATSTASPSPTATATATATAAQGNATRTIKGKDEFTRFGDVQVAITMKGGRITDVQPVTLPSDRPRSQLISQQAAPLLRSEVLAAQSAHINLLSGATYTSDAWAASVQSAIDQAG